MSNRFLTAVFRIDNSQFMAGLREMRGDEGGDGGMVGFEAAITKAQLAWAAYGTAAVLAGKEVAEQIEEYTRYIGKVEELSQGLGITAEDAAYLTGMMDENGISTSALMNIFEDLVNEGIDPSLQALVDLMTELDTYPEGAERTGEAMDRLGNEGIGPLMDWWNNLTDAEQDNIDLSRGDYQSANADMISDLGEFEEAVGELETAWMNFKNTIIADILPTLTILLGKLTDIQEVWGGIATNAGIIWDSATSQKPGWGSLSETKAILAAQQNKGMQNLPEGFATGGSFRVGGTGGVDSTPVSFMATPGEEVSIGGGTSDMQNILSEVRRLVDSLPGTIADAMERY